MAALEVDFDLQGTAFRHREELLQLLERLPNLVGITVKGDGLDDELLNQVLANREHLRHLAVLEASVTATGFNKLPNNIETVCIMKTLADERIMEELLNCPKLSYLALSQNRMENVYGLKMFACLDTVYFDEPSLSCADLQKLELPKCLTRIVIKGSSWNDTEIQLLHDSWQGVAIVHEP
ncbi:MAG: hypothetical protein U0795_07375 [Pirellulales bacterium]